MKRVRLFAVLVVLIALAVSGALAQTGIRIAIPAGTPEDQAITSIGNEPDAAKRTALWEDFLQKFSSNPAAVAYGNWQLSQAAQSAGKPEDALALGDKALAAMPNVVDILVSQADIAQQLKSAPKTIEYAARAVKVIDAQPEDEKKALQQSRDYLETAAYNAIMGENDPKARLAEIEKFEASFPNSKFETEITQQAFASLQQSGDPSRMYAFGEHVLQTNPNSVPTLITLADAYADDPKDTKGASLTKAIAYAKKAIDLTKPDAPDADHSRKVLGGLAHSVLGRAFLKQEKATWAIPEFKAAINLLENDPTQQQPALYFLGYAYAKENKIADAKDALTKAAAINGPMTAPSKELLAKVNAAARKK